LRRRWIFSASPNQNHPPRFNNATMEPALAMTLLSITLRIRTEDKMQMIIMDFLRPSPHSGRSRMLLTTTMKITCSANSSSMSKVVCISFLKQYPTKLMTWLLILVVSCRKNVVLGSTSQCKNFFLANDKDKS
ncbi:unnamed protein product, partial [Heterosigma akashiwo]